jgi:hypothetical protein
VTIDTALGALYYVGDVDVPEEEMPMKRLATVVMPACIALVLATSVLAATTTYAGPRQWQANESAGSAFRAGWHGNHFSTMGSGFDKTVTFIDNVRYAWHNTVRNRSGSTDTIAPSGLTTKGHCRAHVGNFWGSCWLHH